MMGGRVIEENIDFYRYLICRLPPASVLMIKKIANCLQFAIKRNIMKKKEGGDIYGKNSKCICTC